MKQTNGSGAQQAPRPHLDEESYPALRDEAIRLSLVGQILRRWRRLLAALVVLGAGLGALAWVVLPTTFESTSTVLLQGGHSDDQVRTEAQISTSRVVASRAAIALGWDPETIDDDAVSTEVRDGNVMKITARAEGPGDARRFAQQVTEEYIRFSTQIADRAAEAAAAALSGRREELERQLETVNQAIDARHLGLPVEMPRDAGPTDLNSLRASRTDLLRELNDIVGLIAKTKAQAAVGRASIRVIEPPEVPRGPATPTLLLLVAGGAGLAPVLGTAVLVAARLADKRLRRRSDISSALGAPVLGMVQPATDPTKTEPARGGWRARARRLLDTDPAPVARDRSLDDLRYRRVLDRLRRTSEGLRLLVVAVEDDPLAAGAVVQLAVAAAAGGRPVSVLTDNQRLATMVEAGTVESEPASFEVLAAHTPTPTRDTTLHLQTVQAARPTIANYADVSGVLVVVTSGTRTPSELFALAEACYDAVLPIRGALVVVPPNAEEEVDGEPRTFVPEQPTAVVATQNGHARGGTT